MVRTFIVLVFFVTSASASAHVHMMNCKILDESGNVVSTMKPFAASAKGDHVAPVIKGFAVGLRWRYFSSPLEVLLFTAPYYPFTLGEKVLERTDIRATEGMIKGVVPLDKIKSGYTLDCEESAL